MQIVSAWPSNIFVATCWQILYIQLLMNPNQLPLPGLICSFSVNLLAEICHLTQIKSWTLSTISVYSIEGFPNVSCILDFRIYMLQVGTPQLSMIVLVFQCLCHMIMDSIYHFLLQRQISWWHRFQHLKIPHFLFQQWSKTNFLKSVNPENSHFTMKKTKQKTLQ